MIRVAIRAAQDDDFVEEAAEIMEQEIREAVGDRHCAVHQQSATIIIRGTRVQDLRLEIEACCDAFGEEISGVVEDL